MGTRSLTVMLDGNGEEIAVLYRQYDGYPSGHGVDLASFLSPLEVVNGFNSKTQCAANGMACLSAQIVAHFKEGIGSIYLYPAGTRDAGEEYVYTVYQDDGQLKMKVQAGKMTFFGLPGTKQDNMPVIFDGPAGDFNPDAADENQEKVYENIPNDWVEEQEAE